MLNYIHTDYHDMYDELLKRHIGPEYYPIHEATDKYELTQKEATTLDEYLDLLVTGHINVTLREGLNTYWLELLENEWFLRWPLVRWSYASRLLHGTGCRANKKKALKHLLPLSKEGCPGALYDIGFCYRYSGGLELNYERGICLWIEASNRGYYTAWEELYREYDLKLYKEFDDKLRLFFLYEVFSGLLRFRAANSANWLEALNEEDRKVAIRIFKEGRTLQKQLREKSLLWSAAESLLPDDDNPYV